MTRFRKRTWLALFLLFALALGLRFNLRQGRVSGPSMTPTYDSGDTVLVWMTAPRSRLKPGDVVVLRDKNGDELIKRIAFIRPAWSPAPPGGTFRTINGARDVPWAVLFGAYFANVATHKLPVPPPENTIYIMGDNLLNSDDSRHFGPISPRQILGKVIP